MVNGKWEMGNGLSLVTLSLPKEDEQNEGKGDYRNDIKKKGIHYARQETGTRNCRCRKF